MQTLMNELSRGDQRLRSEIDKLHQEIKKMSVVVAQAQDVARDELVARQNAAMDFLKHWIELLKAAGIIGSRR